MITRCALARAPVAAGSLTRGIHLSKRRTSGPRSAAQARPTGTSENGQPIEHSESDDPQYRQLDERQPDQRTRAQQVDELLREGSRPGVKANLAVMQVPMNRSKSWNDRQERVKLRPQFWFLKDSTGDRPDPGADDHAGDRRHRRFAGVGNYASYCRCVGSQKSATVKKRQGQYQERQQVSGLGVCRSGQLRHPVQFQDQEFLSEKEIQEPWRLWRSKRWPTSCAGLVTTS